MSYSNETLRKGDSTIAGFLMIMFSFEYKRIFCHFFPSPSPDQKKKKSEQVELAFLSHSGQHKGRINQQLFFVWHSSCVQIQMLKETAMWVKYKGQCNENIIMRLIPHSQQPSMHVYYDLKGGDTPAKETWVVLGCSVWIGVVYLQLPALGSLIYTSRQNRDV